MSSLYWRQFAYSVLIVVFIPAILILNLYWHNKNFTNTLNTELTSKAELTAQALSTTVTESINYPNTIKSKIDMLIGNGDIQEITVYKYENGSFAAVSSTNSESEVKVLSDPNSSQAWAGKKSVSKMNVVNDHRVFSVTTPIYNLQGDAVALLVCQISAVQIDALIAKNNQQSVYLLIGSILVVMILLINHFHFVSYAKLLSGFKQVNQLRDRFLNRTTLDLQNPLTNIKNDVETIEKLTTGNIDPESIKLLENIRLESGAALMVIGDILDLNKIEHNQIELNRQEINPAKICQEVIAKMSPVATANRYDFDFTVDKTQSVILVDPNRLQQQITSLINIIIERSAGGKISLRYEQVTKNRWSITVSSDTFHYKDANYQNINQMTTAKDQTTNLAEFGVNFWLVEQLAHAMGGHIETQFNPPSQMVFRLIYPEVKVIEFPKSPEAVAPTITSSNIYA